MELIIFITTILTLCIWAYNYKPTKERKQPVRRPNGQIARKMIVNYYGKFDHYEYR